MQQGQVDDLGFCPSFNCYYSDTLASTAATRVSSQLQQEQAARFHDVEEEDFAFSLMFGDEAKGITSDVFPLFNFDPMIKVEVDRENDYTEDACSSSLEKLFINEREESPSSSSSESEGEPSGVFCVWRHTGSSSPLSKCKKSSSTGSGSKRWRIRDLLRRSNSEGKEPTVLLTRKIPKQKRNSEVSKVAGKLKPSVHELFYVQQREGGRRKSYLPYRQGLVGFFNNGKGKRLA